MKTFLTTEAVLIPLIVFLGTHEATLSVLLSEIIFASTIFLWSYTKKGKKFWKNSYKLSRRIEDKFLS